MSDSEIEISKMPDSEGWWWLGDGNGIWIPVICAYSVKKEMFTCIPDHNKSDPSHWWRLTSSIKGKWGCRAFTPDELELQTNKQ